VNHGTAERRNTRPDSSEYQELGSNVTRLRDRSNSSFSVCAGSKTDRDEAVQQAVSVAIDAEQRIAQLQRRIDQLEKLAVTDELTGLLNRRGFESQLSRAIELSRRHGEPGLLIYVDLDGFKMVNDTYGHAAGDAVLKQVARLLTENVRSTDFVGRLGGDEFAVLLSRTSVQNGMRRVQALSRLLNPIMIGWKGGTLSVGASFGIEPYDGEAGGCAETVISRADYSMYTEKRLRTAPHNNALAS